MNYLKIYNKLIEKRKNIIPLENFEKYTMNKNKRI